MEHIHFCVAHFLLLIYTYVNVEPDAVLLTDVSDRVDGIKGSVDGGPGREVEEEGQVTLGFVPDNQLL